MMSLPDTDLPRQSGSQWQGRSILIQSERLLDRVAQGGVGSLSPKASEPVVQVVAAPPLERGATLQTRARPRSEARWTFRKAPDNHRVDGNGTRHVKTGEDRAK
jgi:hypothetical protein